MFDARYLLEKAVGIPSVSGEEAALAHFLVEQMSEFCDKAFIDEAGNAIAQWGHGEFTVYVLGHIDTVPGDIPVRVEEGSLWGRGSVDAKGPFCTAIAAVSQLDPSLKDAISLMLIGATEEEVSSSKGARYALKAYPKPDCVIIGEPSGWDAVTLGYKGRLLAKLQLVKENFHSAGQGTTAAEDLSDTFQALKVWANQFNQGIKGIFDRVQLSLQDIRSDNDGLLQKAEASFGLRLPTSLSPQEAEAIIRAYADGTWHFLGHEQAYRGGRDTVLSRAFRVAIRQSSGKPRSKLKTGTSDMNVVAPHWNVPMLAYGPGDSALDHRPNEHLSLNEYDQAIAVMTTALSKLAS